MHEKHRQRVRERFKKESLDNFSDHNVLEFLLFHSIPRRDTNETAHRLMNAFGSLSGVLEAPIEELCKIDGIGENSAILINLIPQICRRYLDDKHDVGEIIDSTEKAGGFFMHKYIGRKDEMVSMLCLDNKCRVQHWVVVSEGTVNAAEVSVRKVLEHALRQSATSVIVCHNHPSGLALPSGEDLVTTRKIEDALASVGINLMDHIIIADNDFISLADSKAIGHVATTG